MATRPILLHVFRSNIEARANDSGEAPTAAPEGAQKIAQTCIQCARHSFRLLSEAWIQGSFALFDYFYTQYLFSAAIVLVISALFDINNERTDADDFDTSIQILYQLAESGNFGAKEFCLHIDAMQQAIEESPTNSRGNLRLGSTVPALIDATPQILLPYPSPAMTTGMALTDSSLQQFLAQPDHNFQLANMTGLDEMQTPFWPDLWVGNWMNP
jgi:proline utilization trans-activator